MTTTQRDRDRANELGQKLGTLAAIHKEQGDNSIQAKIAFEAACYETAVELFAKHREEALLRAATPSAQGGGA